MATSESQTHSAFFYGTLMSPPILARVCAPANSQSSSRPARKVTPAILLNHRRHRVRHVDYPAIVPVSPEQKSTVRGTYVTGLSHEDIRRLDVFEGFEYGRVNVKVQLLPAASASVPDRVHTSTIESKEGVQYWEETAQAQTYVWRAGHDRLEDDEWDFDEFVREKLWRWAPGARGDTRGEYDGLEDTGNTNGQADGTGGRSVGGGFDHLVARNGGDDDQ